MGDVLWRAWFDGACEPRNPGGYATWGFWVQSPGDVIYEGYGCGGDGALMSSNVSEYSGAIGVMEWFLKRGLQNQKILVHGDSNMVVQQMSGVWKVRCPEKRKKPALYIPFYQRARVLIGKFGDISFKWIPREENGKADGLSRRWLDENHVKLGWATRMKAKASGRAAFAMRAAA